MTPNPPHPSPALRRATARAPVRSCSARAMRWAGRSPWSWPPPPASATAPSTCARCCRGRARTRSCACTTRRRRRCFRRRLRRGSWACSWRAARRPTSFCSSRSPTPPRGDTFRQALRSSSYFFLLFLSPGPLLVAPAIRVLNFSYCAVLARPAPHLRRTPPTWRRDASGSTRATRSSPPSPGPAGSPRRRAPSWRRGRTASWRGWAAASALCAGSSHCSCRSSWRRGSRWFSRAPRASWRPGARCCPRAAAEAPLVAGSSGS